MSKHTIQISDDYGKSFKMIISIGWFVWSVGTWQSVDSGFIPFSFGKVSNQMSGRVIGNGFAEPTVRHAQLFQNSQSTGYGIRLNDYIDLFGVRDQGMSLIERPWAVGLIPDRFSWMVLD